VEIKSKLGTPKVFTHNSEQASANLSRALNIQTAEKSAMVTSRREIAPRYEDREQGRSRARSDKVSR
jgi:hypothetical protein